MIRKRLMIRNKRDNPIWSCSGRKKVFSIEQKRIKKVCIFVAADQTNHWWEKFAVVKTKHTLARSGLARRQRHECQDHFSRETFQVQVSVNICKHLFHEGSKKLPMHGIANLLSITCPAARAGWVLSISCKLRYHNSKKHSWFSTNIQELISAHEYWSWAWSPRCCWCHWWPDPDTPRGPGDGIQR